MAILYSTLSSTLSQISPALVFPVKANGKTPLTGHGFKDATDDPEQIAKYEEEFPGCN
jgi:Bifunctional DNA primase/polymerase, N-terminal